MPNGLTYLSLRCVLEYLDALKRIPITLRSRVLQRIDTRIPLRIKNIDIHNRQVIIDNKPIQPNRFWKVTDDKVELEERRRAEITKKLFIYYLRGKSDIHVDKVLFNGVRNLENVQVKISMTVNKLSAHLCNIADFHMVISLKSPLQELYLTNQVIILDHPIVYTARSLILKTNKRGIRVPGIEKLPNKKVLVHECSNIEILVLRIINYWIENGKEVGTEYLFQLHYNTLSSILQRFLGRFNEFQNKLEEVDDHFHPKASRFLIPINGTSLRIQVYGRVNREDSKLVLSVVEV
ncbi:hypothetical protein CRE_17983 [Caenorhabditis remanei]|uniref:F-box domain-containing protein n=1 Tax=Caenorhabditis remanei TaxID=31234 RepID=E3MDB5_CAERE|nr:hypothetical protein CRE_17983 [Caenorhabditis remanei]